MKKLIAFVLALTLLNSFYTSAQANEDVKVVAILDTQVDSSMSNRIIHEVCITLNRSCLNNTNFMEGKGAAGVLPAHRSIVGMEHGQQMAATALQANQNTKIVFVRIYETNRGSKGNLSGSSNQHIALGLEWVYKNAQKYSIDAVSISQENANKDKTCPINQAATFYISNLKAMNIFVFAAAGNGGWWNKPVFPSCVSDVIGVGATNANGDDVWGQSNMGSYVDFFSIGEISLLNLNNIKPAGTSVASAYLASVWINKFSGTWSDQYKMAQLLETKVIQKRSGDKYPFINN